MRQTVPSHPVIASYTMKHLFYGFAIILFTCFFQNHLAANTPANHRANLAIGFTFVPGDITVECNNVPGPETPVAQDDCIDDISLNLTESSNQTFDGSCSDHVYNIIRTWTATNNCGEVATATQTVSVIDSQSPTLSEFPADVTLYQSQGATIPDNNVTAFDNCSSNVSFSSPPDGVAFGGCQQNIGRTWIALDACGNAVTHSQQITYIYDFTITFEVQPQTCTQLGSAQIVPNNGFGDYEIFWHVDENNTSLFQGNLEAGDYDMFIIDNLTGCKQEMIVNIPFDCDPNGCNATAGTLSANGAAPCQNFVGQAVNFSATPNGNSVVPNGYQTTYVLTSGGNLVIQDASPTPDFVVTNTGNYTIHTLVYDPNSLDLGIIQIGVTTGFEVNNLLQQGGGGICAALDVSGAGFSVIACETMCDEPEVDNIVVVESTCNNSSGSINIEMVSGNQNFNFAWDPAISSGSSAANVGVGVYTVIISSNLDPVCNITESIVVGNLDGPQAEILSAVPANCSEANGQIVLTPDSYNYNWGTTGVGTANPSERINLLAGEYQVTVTDPGNPNCFNIIEVEVEQSNNIDPDFIVGVYPDVNQSNGAVIITTNAGGLYNFSWSDNVQTMSPNRFDLAAGDYCVTVTDTQGAGCEDEICFVLTNNLGNGGADITLNSDLIAVSCVGESDGMIMYSVNLLPDFVQPANEYILDANGNQVANGTLTPGDYCVVVEDGNGNLAAQACFEVVEPDAIVLDIQPTNITCLAGGSILLSTTGGSGGYSYNWSDGNTNEDRTNLGEGTFTVTVTDMGGCDAISPPIIIVDTCDDLCDAPTVENIVVVEATCGNSDGYVEVSLVEDITGYTFNWSPNLGTANAEGNTRTGVPAGSYTITIVDNNDPNCGTEVIAVVGNSDGPEATVLATFSATCEESNGTATIVPATFQYTWSDNNSMGDIRSDLAAGTYQVTVTDTNSGCINVLEVEIGTVNPLVGNVNIVAEPDCGQANGVVVVGAFGGTNNYTYQWSNGSTETSLDNLQAGPYSITITDFGNLGCVTVVNFTLLNNLPDDAEATVNLAADTFFVSCVGMMNANAVFTTEFGPNFTVPGTVEIFQNGNVVNNGSLGVGDYCVVVTDGNGCLAGEACFTVLDPELIDLDIEVTPISCITGGIINVIASGGDGNYTYEWSGGSPNQSSAVNLIEGTYALTVTDGNGCSASASNLEIVNACSDCDPFFASDELTINAFDCDTGGELCIGISVSNFGNVTVEDNFMDYTGPIDGCDFDTSFFYTTAVLPDQGAAGPYTVNEWVVDAFTFGPQQFQTIEGLVMQMNAWDPSGNWVSNTGSFTIEGGNLNSTYGPIVVIQDATGSTANMELNINAIPQGTQITLDEGAHIVVLSDTLTGCSDTLNLMVICDSLTLMPDTISIVTPIGITDTFCLDTTELVGALVSIENICDDGDNTDVMIINDHCFEYFGFEVGVDTSCWVLCDEFGYCDTTIVYIDVFGISPETIYDTIPIIDGPYGPICVDTTELSGTIVSIENICPEDSGPGNMVTFDIDEDTYCVTYDGTDFGTDPACIVICDDLGICDTTYIVITVIQGDGDPPMLTQDEAETIKNVAVTIEVSLNDMIGGDALNFGVAEQPNNGDAEINPVNQTITYSPANNFSGSDQFTYFFTNENGSDTTTVFLDVLPDCLIIHDGISPNGDDLNEGWILEGIENFPNNEVCVYNRWGNQVYRKNGYQNNNPFDGTWEGLDLPSGTYFYVIDTGTGEKFNGILQINR